MAENFAWSNILYSLRNMAPYGQGAMFRVKRKSLMVSTSIGFYENFVWDAVFPGGVKILRGY